MIAVVVGRSYRGSLDFRRGFFLRRGVSHFLNNHGFESKRKGALRRLSGGDPGAGPPGCIHYSVTLTFPV